MSGDNTFSLSTDAARKYESQKVPAVFEPMARATLDTLSLPADAAVIDIACGTGIIPRLLADRLPGVGRIVGTDLNPAMIEVARSTMPPCPHRVDWRACDVTDLPFDDGTFDIAFCQQGLQFFPDKPAALREIRRVLVPGGMIVAACWRKVSPLLKAVSDSLRRHVSETAARQALGPYSLTDRDAITSLLTEAGFSVAESSVLHVDRTLIPAGPAIRRELLASPYERELLDKGEETVDRVAGEVLAALQPFRTGDGGDGLTVPEEVNLFRCENAALQ